jgi:hypothetical protein
VKRHFDDEDITLAPPSAQELSGEVAVTDGTLEPTAVDE